MRPVRSVAVLMPTYQGMEFLERVLEALARQEFDRPWSLRIVDSGSRDGTWECLGAWAERFPVPLHRERIDKVSFDHGDTRNLLAARSPEADLLVFLTQDAIPSSSRWLRTLVSNFEDEAVGAATCRNVPRPDCHPLTRLFSAQDPGYAPERREVTLPDPATYAELSTHERRLLYNFNDVASAIRRELWERHPFPRTWFGEDVLMARALLEAGHVVVYDAEATVEHSHDYDARETYERAHIDGRFNAEWLDRICVGSEKDARVLTERVSAEDRPGIASLGYGPAQTQDLIEEGRAQRSAAFLGLHDGGRAANRYPGTKLLERTDLHILYVVHGFPPDTWAGTEIYTFNLAREMQRRGHRCTILARVPAGEDDETPDFQVTESEFQGLRVLRMTHRLQHANLRESYHQPRAEAAFRGVLAREQPDLVHFQHLIHSSAGLVHVAREEGLPTMVHCHDFWALCARVQLIRPDGTICKENMGAGCYACIKEESLDQVERLRDLGQQAGDLITAHARAAAKDEGTSDLWRRRAQEFGDLMSRQEFVLGAYAAADLCVSPSRFLRDRLLESGRFDKHRFLYSDNGMRTDHVEALEKRPSEVVRFGFVGSLVWYKGGETLVRAMAGVEGATLGVYGDFKPESDPHHGELARLAGDNVTFHGRFDNARLSEVFAEIDVLVVPSLWYENSPVTIHEAWLTRTPVLASGIGGMAEYVRDGVDGLHFAVGDAEDLAAKMRRFVREPGLLAMLSSDFPPIKTIAEDAAETESRYRALCCVERVAVPRAGWALELGARDTVEREGAVDEQGADFLLLRPGGRVNYDLGGLSGMLRLSFELHLLTDEHDVVQLGQVLAGEQVLCTIGPEHSGSSDSARRVELDLEVPEGTTRLSVVAGSDEEPSGVLRMLGLRVARLLDEACT